MFTSQTVHFFGILFSETFQASSWQHPNQKISFDVFIGCPEDRFKKICNSIDAKRIKTFKEIDISFTPTESHVFSLDCIDHFHHYCNPQQTSTKGGDMQKMAEKIVSLCSTLGEYPSIRYRA